MTNQTKRFFLAAIVVLASAGAQAQLNQETPGRGMVLLDGVSFDKWWTEYRTLSREDLQTQFLRDTGIEKPSGPAALFLASLPDIAGEYEDRYENEIKGTKEDICRKARAEKEAYHKSTSGTVPIIFGKIVDPYTLEPASGDSWTGDLHLCSWVGNDEYYIRMRFKEKMSAVLRLHDRDTRDPDKPFPGTLDLDPTKHRDILDMIKAHGWDYKLHASGKPPEISVVKNGTLLPPSDAFYSDPDGDCVDIFFRERPKPAQLPASQEGFCMGRCNAAFINTM